MMSTPVSGPPSLSAEAQTDLRTTSTPGQAERLPGVREPSLGKKHSWCSYTLAATFISGGVAGAVSRTVTAPLDRIKIIVQEGHLVQQVANHQNVTSAKTPRLMDVVRLVNNDGGIRAFWRGNGVNCLKAGPEFAIVFSFRRLLLSKYDEMIALENQMYEAEVARYVERHTPSVADGEPARSPLEGPVSRSGSSTAHDRGPPASIRAAHEGHVHITHCTAYHHLPVQHPSCLPYPICWVGPVTHIPSIFINFSIGALTGSGAQLFLYPLEVVKTRIIVSRSTEFGGGIREVVREAYQHGGVAEFYRGITPNIVGIFLFRGLEVGLYSNLRQSFISYRMEVKGMSRHDASLSAMETAAAATFASAVAQTVTYPLNVVRTRLQTQGANGRAVRYRGMMDCFVQMIRHKGVRSLFHGLTANYMKALPASATTFVVFEKMQTLLVGDD